MKLRIGIIGCGGIATGKHLSALKSNGDLCEVVAFCDGILDRAKKAAQEYGVENAQVCQNYKELLANHLRTCVSEDIREGQDEMLEEVIAVLQKLMK